MSEKCEVTNMTKEIKIFLDTRIRVIGIELDHLDLLGVKPSLHGFMA